MALGALELGDASAPLRGGPHGELPLVELSLKVDVGRRVTVRAIERHSGRAVDAVFRCPSLGAPPDASMDVDAGVIDALAPPVPASPARTLRTSDSLDALGASPVNLDAERAARARRGARRSTEQGPW